MKLAKILSAAVAVAAVFFQIAWAGPLAWGGAPAAPVFGLAGAASGAGPGFTAPVFPERPAGPAAGWAVPAPGGGAEFKGVPEPHSLPSAMAGALALVSFERPAWAVPGAAAPAPPAGGCSGGGCDPAEVEWSLVSYGPTGTEHPVLPDSEVTVELGPDGQLFGCAGCNRYFAGYTLGPDGAIQVGLIGATKMWCEGLMQQEDGFLAALGDASSYRVEGEQLFVYYDDGSGVMIFEK